MILRLLITVAALPAMALLSAVGTIVRYRHSRRDARLPEAASQAGGGRRLRVLFVTRDLPFHGGVARCILYLARACDAQRVEVFVASLIPPTEPMVAAFKELGIIPVTLRDGGYIGPSRRLRRMAREHGVDVVVGTTFKTYLVSKLAARSGETRAVFWIHALHGVIEGWGRRALYALLSRRDPLLFVSEAVRSANLPASHLGMATVIHNGVEDVEDDPDQALYPREKLAEFGVPANALVLAYVAEFVAWKDHATAIAAVGLLRQRGVNVHLLLAGRGMLMKRTQEAVQAMPHADCIHFLGPRNDVRRLFGMIDIYVHPAQGEGFGLAVAEAMLARRPIIAAAAGAVVEYVRPGVNGELFRCGDAVELADKIVQLAGDRARARRLGEAARERCLVDFSIDRFADRVCEFLEQTVAITRTAGGRR